MTDIIQRLQIRYPIIQAPMAGVSTPELAAAVSNAGGLGSIAPGASTVDQGREMIRKTKSLTERPFNANVFCHAPAKPDPLRERAWIEYLSPLFSEFGATPPTSLREDLCELRDWRDDARATVRAEARGSELSLWLARSCLDSKTQSGGNIYTGLCYDPG